MAHDKRTRQKLETELLVLLKKGRLERAALVLQTILEKDQDDDRLFIKLAEVKQKLGDEPGVRAAFRSAAAAAEKKGFYLRAMASLRQLARYLPPPERPWTELAELAVRLGLVGDALGFIDEGYRAWDAAGDRPAMLRATLRAHELAPDDVHRTLRLVLEHRAAGRRDEALTLLTAEAARHKEAGRAEAWLALASERSALDPSDRTLACEVATAYLERGEPRQALKRLQSLLRERAQHIDSLRLLVRTFEALGQPGKRLAALRELARTVTSRGRDAEAHRLWKELLAELPEDPEARRVLGMGPVLPNASVAPRPAAPVAPPPPSVVAPPPAQIAALGDGTAAPLAPPPPSVAAPAPAQITGPPAPIFPAPTQDEEELIDLSGGGVEVDEEELVDLFGSGVEVEDAVVAAPAPEVGDLAPPAEPLPLLAAPTPPPTRFISTPPPGSPLLAPIDLSLLEQVPEPPSPGLPPEGFDDDLAHAEFLVTHRFDEEARELLSALELDQPGHLGLAALRARLQAGPPVVHAHPSPNISTTLPPELHLTPLPAEPALPAPVADEVTGPDPLALDAAPAPPAPSAEAPTLSPIPFTEEAVLDADAAGAIELVPAEVVLARFQEQVALAIAPDDAATHYDLGIAYREMGLIREALAEFEIALASATGSRAIDCLVGMALCEAARGDLTRATRTLKRALAHEALTPPAAAAVLYELGLLREQAGDASGAAWAFDASERSQPRFRDASARAGRLRTGGTPPPAQPGA